MSATTSAEVAEAVARHNVRNRKMTGVLTVSALLDELDRLRKVTEEPVMTETTRQLARRVTQYRRETLGWLKQAIRADGEAGRTNNALIRERQLAALTKGDGHVDCAIKPPPDTVQAPGVTS